MAETRLANLQVPQEWRPWVIEQATANNALIRSGAFTVVRNDSMKAGLAFIVPNVGKIPGRSHVIVEGTNLPVENLATNTMTGVALARGKVIGFHDFVEIFTSMPDPWGILAQRFAEFWEEDQNEIIRSMLEGIFNSTGMAGLVHDITALTGGAELFSRNAYIAAGQRLRAGRGRLAAVVVDSATEAYMSTVNATTGQPIFGQGTNVTNIGTAQVIVDDVLTPQDGDYHVAYLFRQGAGQFLERTNVPDSFESEVFRNALATYSGLVQRRVFVPWLNGTSWVGSISAVSPDNDALATGTNYSRVYDLENMGVVQFRYRLPTD